VMGLRKAPATRVREASGGIVWGGVDVVHT
jgi:hypothetical protein